MSRLGARGAQFTLYMCVSQHTKWSAAVPTIILTYQCSPSHQTHTQHTQHTQHTHHTHTPHTHTHTHHTHTHTPHAHTHTHTHTHTTQSSATDTKYQVRVALKKLARPFQSDVHAKRSYRELRYLKHMKHENVRGGHDEQ